MVGKEFYGLKMKILKKGVLGTAALGLTGTAGLALYGAKQLYDNGAQKTTSDYLIELLQLYNQVVQIICMDR